MFHIVLVQPEIPYNTGNIARTCAVAGAKLHLIRPLGFDISEPAVKRAGLDYWDKVFVDAFDDFESFLTAYPEASCFCVETVGSRRYDRVSYPENAFFVFGRETKGLPQEVIDRFPDQLIRIPMRPGLRSLNLSNAAAIVLFEALRQHDFMGLA
ncbi:MAG: tRNA (cytidine(34)-2'-O)-methyltransferase [Clostridia bacterium]|nr:tRNA (cytidine(34)-2'-O)-methyltransferase [Clostridia bacterium]